MKKISFFFASWQSAPRAGLAVAKAWRKARQNTDVEHAASNSFATQEGASSSRQPPGVTRGTQVPGVTRGLAPSRLEERHFHKTTNVSQQPADNTEFRNFLVDVMQQTRACHEGSTREDWWQQSLARRARRLGSTAETATLRRAQLT